MDKNNKSNEKGSADIGIMTFMKMLESRATLDEFKAMEPVLKDTLIAIAKQLRMFYDALLTQGFTEEQAFNIISAQALAMTNPDIFKGNNKSE
jgi:hypothetical protein